MCSDSKNKKKKRKKNGKLTSFLEKEPDDEADRKRCGRGRRS